MSRVEFSEFEGAEGGAEREDSSSTGFVKKRQNPAKNCLEAADQQQLSSILRVLLFGLSRAA